MFSGKEHEVRIVVFTWGPNGYSGSATAHIYGPTGESGLEEKRWYSYATAFELRRNQLEGLDDSTLVRVMPGADPIFLYVHFLGGSSSKMPDFDASPYRNVIANMVHGMVRLAWAHHADDTLPTIMGDENRYSSIP